ncbi:hypothetical protein NTGHW29_280069 [Candidatus Nitrotoga sp. HW29]|nr:hypothetical protein NTGHW29_280069 [Candidatus Nitrotoga sp. HW29]
MYFRLIKRRKLFAEYINSRSAEALILRLFALDETQAPSGLVHQRRFIEFWQYHYTVAILGCVGDQCDL